MTIYKVPNVCWDYRFWVSSRAIYSYKSHDKIRRAKCLFGCSFFAIFFCNKQLIQIQKKIAKTNVWFLLFRQGFKLYFHSSLIMPIDSILLCKNCLFYFRQIQKIPRYSFLSFLFLRKDIC
jgi:hypothetical protein